MGKYLCPTLNSVVGGSPKEHWSEVLEKLAVIRSVESSASLDIYGQISLTSNDVSKGKFVCGWDKKQKRAYHCALSGLKRCKSLGKDVFFLTLTSSPKTNHQDLRKDWDILVKRIRQQLGFSFQYVKVETFEGYGVIHALYHSAFEGWNYKDIHAWFSKNWFEIHQAYVVWNTFCDSSIFKKVSSYLVQYMSCQRGFFRRSTSLGWIFAGYRKKFVGLIRLYGFRKALFAWDFLLSCVLPDDVALIQFPIGF